MNQIVILLWLSAEAGSGGARQLLDQAAGCYESADYPCAKRLLRQAAQLPETESDPELAARAANGLGVLALVEGRVSEAVRQLERAAAQMPQSDGDLRASVFHNLASALARSGDIEGARQHQQQAIQIWECDPENNRTSLYRGWVSLSTYHGLSRHWTTALADLENAFRYDRDLSAMANYAAILDRLGRRREARDIRRSLPAEAPGAFALADVRTLRAAGQQQVRTR
jgi:tetratricopeptide (TPR) repeat protein